MPELTEEQREKLLDAAIKVVAVVSQKGGCGKSTAARHGSLVLPQCALLDVDPQNTTARWLERRKKRERKAPVALMSHYRDMDRAIEMAAEKNCRYVIIDTPPEHDDQRAIRSAIQAADYVLVPSKTSIDDYEIVPMIAQIIAEYRKPMGFFLSMTRPIKAVADAREFLEMAADKFGADMYAGEIKDRVAYIESAALSQSVFEYDKNGPAAVEMADLWNWVVANMKARGV